MLLSLKVASLMMEATTSLQTQDEAPSQPTTEHASPLQGAVAGKLRVHPKSSVISRQVLYFSVYPDDRDHLDLETGEVFQNPGYARIRRKPEKEDKTISAQLSVYEAKKEEDLAYNNMHYLGEISSDEGLHPSSISFSFALPPRDFQTLLTNIQSGVLPSTVQIDLEHPLFGEPSESHPLQYGWEPDGSGMKWRNKTTEGKKVKIESVSFRYEIIKEAFDSETGEPIALESTSITEVVNQHAKELKDKLAEVTTQIKYVGWIVLGAAVLLILLSRH